MQEAVICSACGFDDGRQELRAEFYNILIDEEKTELKKSRSLADTL
jgi:hypothetical protein